MLVNDPIADMLTRIRNALVAKHESVDVPCSTIKKAIAEILAKISSTVPSSMSLVRILSISATRSSEPNANANA